MRIKLKATRILIAVALVLPFVLKAQTKKTTKLLLVVKTMEDQTKNIVPGSKWYVAELINKGTQTTRLEAIQMSGEYAGTGQFFNCTLQVWKGTWRRLWNDSGPAPRYVEVDLKPGDHKKVCVMLLPSEAGSLGQCVRFKVNTRWRTGPAYTVFSEPFVIGKGPETQGHCRQSNSSTLTTQ